MAKNWKVGEAARAVMEGNKEDILDIGRRFPLFLNLASQANEAGIKILECVPEYCTARKIESVLKGDITPIESDVEDTDGEVEDSAEDKKAPKKETKKAAAKDEYEGKSAKELFTLCKERGLKVAPKKDADTYIKALKKDDAAKAKKAEPKKDADDWDDDVEDKKETKKPEKKESKKDDDDEWDI